MCKINPISNTLYFDDEPFTKREAWRWILDYASGNEFICSIRYMSYSWKWHRSKVERFIKFLRSETLIETHIKSGKLAIKACNLKESDKPISFTKTNLESNSRQEQDRIFLNETIRDKTETGKTQENSSLKENDTHCLETLSETQEEEKKRSKRKKEEERLQKEKNTPFRELKKEKVSAENTVKTFAPKPKITFAELKTPYIKSWAEENISDTINLEWELGKFKDYWQSTRKKPPNDVIAAFRNWLRKAYEYQLTNQRGTNERFNNQKQGRNSGINNFLLGAAELVAKLERN